MRSLGVALAIVASVASGLSASTFMAVDRSELVERSLHVVEGRVVEVRSFWTESRDAIVTDARIEIDETVVGDHTREVTVRTFGGVVDDYVIEAHGFPRFERGERVLLFLRKEPSDDTVRVTGYQQGHYRIVDRGGVDVAVPTLDSGTSLVVPEGRIVPPAETVRLDEFKSELRELAAEDNR